MITSAEFRALALSFPGTEEHPHFERVAFKVTGKRIFASLLESAQSANIMLSPKDQAEFCTYDAKAIYPVPNKWGLKGVTTFDLQMVSLDVLTAAITSAYEEVINPNRDR